MWSLGLSIYTTTLLIVTLKLAIHTPRYTLYHIVCLFFSILVYIATLYFNSISPKLSLEWTNIKAQATFIFASPSLWFFIALGPIAACLPDTTFQIFFNQKSPKDFHILQEMEHGWQNNAYISHHQDYVDQISDFTNEQVIEEDGSNLTNDEIPSSQTIFIDNLLDGGNIETIETSSSNLNDVLNKPKWKENLKNDEVENYNSNHFLLNKDVNIEDNCYIPTQAQKKEVHIKFHRSFRIHNKKNKGSKPSLPKQSAIPFEMVEASGIVQERGEKSISPWKNLAKRWSLTPAPQRQAPIQIKSQNDLKMNSQQKPATQKFNKKVLKANPAMSRLTRLASTKIHISNMDLFLEDEDELIDPSNQRYNVTEPIMPSSLPYIPKIQDQYLYDNEQNISKVKGDTRNLQNYKDSSIKPRSSEYLIAAGLIDHNWPTVYHQGHNRSSASHLGYSASKPETLNFIMPTQSLRPSLEDNLRPARGSTIDHYSHLTGGPNFHDNNLKATRRDEYIKSMEHSKSDQIGNNVKENRGSSFYDDDYNIEYKNDYEASTSRTWNEDFNDEKKNAKKAHIYESRFPNLEPYRNEELDAYNSLNGRNFKEKQKPSKFQSSYNRDFELSAYKIPQGLKQSYKELNLMAPMDSTSGKDQPMYRRVSASGHVSSILQPSTLAAPPHESPFADYTKHGLRESLKLSPSEETIKNILILKDEDTLIDKQAIVLNNKLPKPLMQTSKPLKLAKVGIVAELKQGELQRSSSGHISKEIVSNVIGTIPHESSFADYSKHGIREQPIQQETIVNSIGQTSLNVVNAKEENIVNSTLIQVPYIPMPSNFVNIKKSPWASEIGDPSHSINHSSNIKSTMSKINTIPLIIARPNDIAQTSNVAGPSTTIRTSQTFLTNSRVSLYSNNDVPAYTQVLGVVPDRSSKNEGILQVPKID